MFGQGTLRPDLIESASGLASGHADLIKTHHNDTELVRQLRAKNKVVEPLTEFHKDEVNFELLNNEHHSIHYLDHQIQWMTQLFEIQTSPDFKQSL